MILRDYQQAAYDSAFASWDQGTKNVLLIEPTGGGKTVILSSVAKNYPGVACAIAHRHELVSQISVAFARNNIRHKIIGSNNTVKQISHLHQQLFNKCYVDINAKHAVSSVDTLVKREKQLKNWLPQVGLWIQDEAHHVLRDNKWGKAAELFTNARGLGVTATPLRADGKGLGRHADGLFDDMHIGPCGRELMNMGYLTNYKVFAPPSDLNLEGVKITGTGDFSPNQLNDRVKQSHIVGDVVNHYLRLAPGKLGVTFVNSVETAERIALEYNNNGVPAEVVHGGTQSHERNQILQRFKRREILQLVNVDLFGEGFDLPAIEVISLARPTQSYSLFAQQVGRVLRVMVSPTLDAAWHTYTDEQRKYFISQSTKPYGVIIDHVGNFFRHGRPDTPKNWTLDRRERRTKSKLDDDKIPLKTCLNPPCGASVYEAYLTSCPYCGHVPVPTARNDPKFVDGDLHELDLDTMTTLVNNIKKVDGPPLFPANTNPVVTASIKNQHKNRQDAQGNLRLAMKWWAGVYEAMGHSTRETHKIFYALFGVDVLSAQALGRPDAEKLTEKLWREINRLVDKHNLTLSS